MLFRSYVGSVNSYAITDYKEGGTPSTNSEWPPIIQLLNPDGTPFLTYTDHEYKVEFDMKVDNPSLVSDGATLALLYAKPPYKNGELIKSGALIYSCNIIPAMPFGKLDYLKVPITIDFNKIGTGKVGLTRWRYYNYGT